MFRSFDPDDPLTFTYDNLNRMTVKVVPSRADLTAAQTRDVYFGYDILGRQVHARFDSGASGSDGITNSYNGFGDLLTSQLKMGSFDKTLYSSYDGAGRRTRLTHPENNTIYAFSYCYDALSRLTNIGQGTSCTTTPLATFAYANNGLVSQRSEGSGASSASYGWDDLGRLTSQADAFSGGTNNVAWTFGYNPASQIVTETRSNDSYGFAKSAESTSYAVNGLNQYTSVGGTAHSYDANGNLTGTGAATYTYDIENRLVKAVSGATTTNLVYDPLGRLFEVNQGSSATTTRFLNDGDAMVAELNSSNFITNRFVHGSNAAADDPLVWYSGSNLANKRWLHADHLGSIAAWTNSSGGSPTINKYDEYGLPATANAGRFQYTGQVLLSELSSTACPGGLYYYKARIYSPCLGRFLQTDPVGYEDNFNLYAYVGNDPVNFADPEGEQSDSVMDRRNQALLKAMQACEGKGPECAAAIGKGIGVAAVPATALLVCLGGGCELVAVAGLSRAPTLTALAAELAEALAPGAGFAGSVMLARRLAIEEQLGEIATGKGAVIAGAGSTKPIHDIDRIVATHGGRAGEWQKVSSTSRTFKDGSKIETHAYRNARTGQVVEQKVKYAEPCNTAATRLCR